MKITKRILFLLFVICCFQQSFAQKYTISGYVDDTETGEKLISVNLFDAKSGLGTVSNTYGFFSLTLPQDSVYLSVSYVGYATKYYRMYLDKDVTIDFNLGSAIDLETVEVVASEVEKIEENTRMSTVTVPIEQIKKIPALFGEVDVLKALQLLPGVQSGGEGQSGLYVRGGSPDQNLILLDGVPVYNASHLFGFFSVFNADAIKDVTLTKGGFPARYGGRLSSVIEINMKEGDNNDWHGTGTIGLIASKLTVEGPLVKDKTSLIVSARRTYIDVLAKPLIQSTFKANGSTGGTGYFFYDVNAKINHKFSDKDRLYLSMYTGKDKFYYEEETVEERSIYKTAVDLSWGNLTSALRWNHLWSNKLFSNTTLTYSKYNFQTGAEDRYEFLEGNTKEIEAFNLNYISGIDDLAAKIDFDYVPNPNHFIRFGASAIAHDFKPGDFDLDIESSFDGNQFTLDTVFGQKPIDAVELAAYVEDDFNIGENFKVNAGLHFSAFAVNDEFYTSLQPRLGMRYLLPNGFALKGSYASMRQYIQLLTNGSIGLPTDLWLPTTDKVKPQDSWQAALGIAKTIGKQYEFSVEGYYKEMTNLLAYKEGASLFETGDWQERVTQGSGKSYGAEMLLQKKRGKLTGWIGYTLSWTTRQFDELNFGKRFDYKYDRRHDFSIVGSYKFNDRITLSATWVYGTGNAITLGNSQYKAYLPFGTVQEFLNGNTIENEVSFYEERNNFRMRAYHRFDIGVNFTKKKKKYERTFTLGFYNLYSRKNPFFIFTAREAIFDQNGNQTGNETVLKQASIFPILPSVAWTFKF